MSDQSSEPQVTVYYIGKEKRKFGVLVQGIRYRVDPKRQQLTMPKSHADSLLNTAGGVWSDKAPPSAKVEVAAAEYVEPAVPMSKRLKDDKAEG